MNEIQNYLKNLYLRAGIRINVDAEGKMTYVYNDSNIDKIYDAIMGLRDTNYQFYLKVLSVMIFTLPEDYSVEEENYPNMLKVYEVLKLTSSVEEFDAALYENDIFEILTILIRSNLEMAFEYDLECLWFMLCQDLDALPDKAKFLSNKDLMDIFKRSVSYASINCPEILIDLIQIFYFVTRDIEKSYLLNTYIIVEILRNNNREALAIYMYGIFWNNYQHGVWSAPKLTDKKLVSFLSNFESSKKFRQNQYNNFITFPDKARVLRYFLEYEVTTDTIREIRDTEKNHKTNMETFRKKLDNEIQDFVNSLNFGKRI